MARNTVGPLTGYMPIVDREGRPTTEFLIRWNEQARVNGTIPDLSAAAKVSDLLDLIGSTQGSLLIRGASAWQELETPGGTTKFLRADGTYAIPDNSVSEDDINLSDVLTNNVSSTRHGFAPKLPNDSTKYLDGSGQWTTPAGGGGGGGVGAWQEALFNSVSSSAAASKGGVVRALVDGEIHHVWTRFAEVAGATYVATLWNFVDSGSGELGTQIGSGQGWTGQSGVSQRIVTLDNPWRVSAGDRVVLLVTRTDGASNYVLPVDGRGHDMLTVPFDNTGPFFRVATTSPAQGNINEASSLNHLMHGFSFVA